MWPTGNIPVLFVTLLYFQLANAVQVLVVFQTIFLMQQFCMSLLRINPKRRTIVEGVLEVEILTGGTLFSSVNDSSS